MRSLFLLLSLQIICSNFLRAQNDRKLTDNIEINTLIENALRQSDQQTQTFSSTLIPFDLTNFPENNCAFSDPNYFIFDIEYANIPVNGTNFWSHSNLTSRTCFPSSSFTSPCFEYSNESNLKLTARVYKKKYSSQQEEIAQGLRPVVIYVRGGGYAPGATGLRASNPANESLDDIFCKNLADYGFVVLNIDYRRGWDAQRYFPYKKIISSLDTPLAPESCGCEVSNSCKSFTFLQATYRTAQDIRAAHRKVLSIADYLNVSKNFVFYMGGSTGGIATMAAAYGYNNLPNVKEIPSQSTSRTLAGTCGSIDGIGVPLIAGANMKVAGVISLQAAMPYNVNFVEQADLVDILSLVHGTEDTPVNYCENTLLSGLFQAGNNGSNDVLDDTHITLFGTGAIFNRHKSFGNKFGLFVELPGVEHELNLHGVPNKRMKCFASNPNIFPQACNVLKFSFNAAEQRLAARSLYSALIEPMITFSLQDFYVNNKRTSDVVRIQNALNCQVCSYSVPNNFTICGTSYNSFSNESSTLLRQTDLSNIIGNVMPNPTSNYLEIKFKQFVDFGILAIHDLSGKVLSVHNVIDTDKFELNVSNYPVGEYILLLRNDQQSETYKFIKQ